MTISPIRGRAPAKHAITKFGMRGRVADVIICFKFYRNRLRGFRAVRGQKWGSSIDFDRRPYNSTTVLPVISASMLVSCVLLSRCLWRCSSFTCPPQFNNNLRQTIHCEFHTSWAAEDRRRPRHMSRGNGPSRRLQRHRGRPAVSATVSPHWRPWLP